MSLLANTLWLRIGGGILFLAAAMAWIYGGAQIGFYRTYYGIPLVDPVTEIQYEEKVPAFLPGIETLLLGFAAFAALVLLASFLDARSSRP